jgi:hypothetical protein
MLKYKIGEYKNWGIPINQEKYSNFVIGRY